MPPLESSHRFVLRFHDQVTAVVLLACLFSFLLGSGTAGLPETRRDYAFQVDLNRASAEELTVLPGIGEKLAEGIIQHREVGGPFGSPEEILDVKGIGPKKLEALRDSLFWPSEASNPTP